MKTPARLNLALLPADWRGLVFGLMAWLSVGISPLAVAGDAVYFGILKSIQYQQTNQSVPVVHPTNAYSFSAFAIASTNGALTNATVKPGNTTPLRQLVADANTITWRFDERFSSSAAMESVYPTAASGLAVNYAMNLYGTNDGMRSVSMTFYFLFSPLAYPATPEITNLVAAQNIDSTRAFTLGWNALGGSSLSIVQLSIMDAASNLVYATPMPLQPGALDGTSRSATIPPDVLPAGAQLIGHLSVGNPGMPNTSGYPGATGIPALAKDTEFRLQTRPAPARPHLALLSTGTPTQLRIMGETERLYRIESSQNLSTWTNVVSAYANTMPLVLSDTNGPGVPGTFYRVKVGD